MPSVETVYATKVCGVQGEDTPSHSAASVSLKHRCSMRDSFISGGQLEMTGANVGFYNCGGGRAVRRDTGIQWAEARDAAECPAVCGTALPQRAMGPKCQPRRPRGQRGSEPAQAFSCSPSCLWHFCSFPNSLLSTYYMPGTALAAGREADMAPGLRGHAPQLGRRLPSTHAHECAEGPRVNAQRKRVTFPRRYLRRPR